jgi:hypothetical protein
VKRRPELNRTAPTFDLWHTADGAVQLQKHPDGVDPRNTVGAADGDVALLAENLRHLAGDVTDAAVSHECARCGTPLTWASAWVSTDYTTTAGGLSFCPPDPDAARVGVHVPQSRPAAGIHAGATRPTRTETRYLKETSMSYTDDRPTVRITTFGDLLALIPIVVGYPPADSLVVAVLNTDGIPFMARLDLPEPGPTPPELAAAWDTVTANLTPWRDARIVLIGYGPADQVQAAITPGIHALRHAGIPVNATLRVADGHYWHLDRPDTADGTPFDTATSPVTATAVYAGLVTSPSRDALAATLDPVTGTARERMVLATADACAFLLDLLEAARPDTGNPGVVDEDPDAVLDTPLGLALQLAARTYLSEVQDSYRAGQPVDDDRAAVLTVLLNLTSVRDYAARLTSTDAWQQQMWTDLVRRAEPAFTAGPAILLALCALRCGDGVLAGIAVSRALDADPDDRLAQLLHRAISAGIDPDTVAGLLAA